MRTLAIVCLLAACGSAPPPHQAEPAHAPAAEPQLPGVLADFDHAFGPRWRQSEGAPRMHDTCAARSQLEQAVAMIVHSPPPECQCWDPWTPNAKALLDADRELEASCTSGDLAAFDAALVHVHDAFEALVTLYADHVKQKPA